MEIEGGPICYSLPYSKNYPLDMCFANWRYIDKVCAYYNQLGIPITYSIADTSIATIDGTSGEITILKPGITTVTASQDDGGCISGSGNMTLTINKKDINIDADDVELTFGDDLEHTLSASYSNTTSNFTYTIADGTKASITGNILTVLKAGSTSITVSHTPDDYYNPISKVINLTIDKGTPSIDFLEITKNTICDNTIIPNTQANIIGVKVDGLGHPEPVLIVLISLESIEYKIINTKGNNSVNMVNPLHLLKSCLQLKLIVDDILVIINIINPKDILIITIHIVNVFDNPASSIA